MKILFDGTILENYNKNNGHKAGVYYVAMNLLKNMKLLGADITIYCDFLTYYVLKNCAELNDFKIFKENSLLRRILGYIYYKMSTNNVLINKVLSLSTRFYNKKLYIANKKNIEQINNYDAYFSPFTPPSKDIEKSNIPKFRMIHDIIPILERGLDMTKKDWHQWYNRIYYTINENDYYFTNSEYTRKDVLKHFPCIKDSHIKTTLLAANKNFYPSSEKSPIDGEYIFSLCTLGKRKNLEFGIKNFFNFIQKNNIQDLKLVLGGSVWKKYEPELNNILKEYDSSKIILTGYIDEIELAKYYSNALCFIYPSLYEGFGLPVLESMQCGCPVITSNTTSLPEVVGNAGIQVTPTSDEEMILAYEKMYFNADFREECRNKGFERAAQFSWKKCAKEILGFINQKICEESANEKNF